MASSFASLGATRRAPSYLPQSAATGMSAPNPYAIIAQKGPAPAGVTGAPGGATAGGAPELNLKAETYPALDALLKDYRAGVDDMKSRDGRALDMAGSKIRDMREGGRQALKESEGIRGVKSSNRLSGYDVGTQTAGAQAIAGTAMAREDAALGALGAALPLATAAPSLALQEKNLQLGGYNAKIAADQAANQTQFNQFLALLQANRSKPEIYTGGF